MPFLMCAWKTITEPISAGLSWPSPETTSRWRLHPEFSRPPSTDRQSLRSAGRVRLGHRYRQTPHRATSGTLQPGLGRPLQARRRWPGTTCAHCLARSEDSCDLEVIVRPNGSQGGALSLMAKVTGQAPGAEDRACCLRAGGRASAGACDQQIPVITLARW